MASESKDENPEHINLKVMGQDGNVVQFKIKKHTALKKLMSTYCERAGLALQTIRFSFDGTRINESDTPKGLDMEDGDTIEVFQQQSGGGRGCDSGMKGRPRSSDRRGSTIQAAHSIWRKLLVKIGLGTSSAFVISVNCDQWILHRDPTLQVLFIYGPCSIFPRSRGVGYFSFNDW